MSDMPMPDEIVERCRQILEHPDGVHVDVVVAARELVTWADDPNHDPAAGSALFKRVIAVTGEQVSAVLEGVRLAINARPAPGDQGKAN